MLGKIIIFFVGILFGIFIISVVSANRSDDYRDGYNDGYKDATEKYKNLP